MHPRGTATLLCVDAPSPFASRLSCRSNSSIAYLACAGWQIQFQKLDITGGASCGSFLVARALTPSCGGPCAPRRLRYTALSLGFVDKYQLFP